MLGLRRSSLHWFTTNVSNEFTVLNRRGKWMARSCSSTNASVQPTIATTTTTSTPMKKDILTVSLVGRPNTGKSTLFNRLTRSRQAIVSNIPGTTRDRKEGKGYLAGLPLHVIDTGGLDDRGIVNVAIQQQVTQALGKSHVIFFMIDAKVGITSLDHYFAKWLRKQIQLQQQHHPEILSKVILLANKTEGIQTTDRAFEVISDAFTLGFGEPILVSATHGDGLGELATTLIDLAKEHNCQDMIEDKKTKGKKISEGDVGGEIQESEEEAPLKPEDRVIQLAIMGRPNVGKSTLLNAFIGEERAITGPVAGLTRDSIHVEWMYHDRQFRLVDTAGLTRLQTNKKLLEGIKEQKQFSIVETLGKEIDKSIVLPGIREVNPEQDPSQFSAQISEYSLISALNALRFAQVVMLVVEVNQGKFNKIDLQLARRCLEEGRGLFIAANKVDLMSQKGIGSHELELQVRQHTEEFFREFGDIPVVSCSGLQSKNMHKLLHTAIAVHDSWSKRISTWVLNKWLKDMMITAPTPRAGDKAVHIKYMTQVKSRPPTFALFANVEELPVFFERFLRSKIQEEFDLKGVPIRFVIRKSEGNAVKKHLLKQGKHTRRGTGLGEAKGRVGPNRDQTRAMKKIFDQTNDRRRRDTRLRKARRG